MAISSILRLECKACGKVAVEKERVKIGKTELIRLNCGHLIASESLVASDDIYASIVFSDGAKPREYQIEAIKFAEAANCNCVIADEQGLGKTIESLCLFRLHPEELLPAVLVVPTTVKLQWMWEIRRICGTDPKFLTQVIQSGKEKALPGFGFYIVTYDLLKKEDMFAYVPEINTLLMDECQRIKDHLSGRAKACQAIAKKVKHIIPMSGTPIKNNAGEYFTVLNMVAPTLFPSYERYLREHCDTYETFYGYKVGGLSDAKDFHELTKNIIIRRTKAEVLKDLPSLDRKFYHVELDAKLNSAYAKQLKELDDVLYDDDMDNFGKSTCILEIMARMRHITGISKVSECADFATEFILSSEDRKLVIFTHHQDVMDMLENTLNKWLETGNYPPVLKLHSGLDGNGRAALVKEFKEGSGRVMIASTLAAGEGLNLQFCSDAVILERQWNPANEEQAEARFHRFGQLNNVSITYMLASGTIDEYFTELVEQKRAIVAQTLDNKEMKWEQNSLMKELAELLVTRGRDKWKL